MSSLLEIVTESSGAEAQKTGSGKSVCIITSATVCCNPRVVKEADALAAAGYNVRVVASQHVEWTVAWDERLMNGRPWKLASIRWDPSNNQAKLLRFRSGIRQRICRTLATTTNAWLAPERAYSRLYDEQLREAVRERADLFIAHNPQALPIAAAAAKHFGVEFAFDSEDLHTGEFDSEQQQSKTCQLLRQLESKYLPKCVYVTAPSDQICDALVERYNLKRIRAVHNVFSWSERKAVDGQIKDRRGSSLSLYWYSQIVGLDRGLQDVIRAAGLLTKPFQIHFRGELHDDVRRDLLQLSTSNRVADNLFFHKPVPPEELLSRACEHDVGLAMEQVTTENHQFTVSNKVFQYLLAGLAVAGTATIGQRAVLESCCGAAFLHEPGDFRSLAASLQQLIDDPTLLERAKRAALQAAQSRWNWENESQIVIDLVSSAVTTGK